MPVTDKSGYEIQKVGFYGRLFLKILISYWLNERIWINLNWKSPSIYSLKKHSLCSKTYVKFDENHYLLNEQIWDLLIHSFRDEYHGPLTSRDRQPTLETERSTESCLQICPWRGKRQLGQIYMCICFFNFCL